MYSKKVLKTIEKKSVAPANNFKNRKLFGQLFKLPSYKIDSLWQMKIPKEISKIGKISM